MGDFHIKNGRVMGRRLNCVVIFHRDGNRQGMSGLLTEAVVALMGRWNGHPVRFRGGHGASKAALKTAVLDQLMAATMLCIHRPEPHDGDEMDALSNDIMSSIRTLPNMGPRMLVILLDHMKEEYDAYDGFA
ncbi:uncharacterized protein LOC132198636 isoform X2 [Neocloeon triangulifer]|uniref:uncharacterized protein LOC132198636 isoform X2 n=1 Tax=Neocloeon triangulifer TaxID=2078957 RepID=UPI00286F9328|nr:uncharacterized protein LOC132198636 isoform X2 [Neocloeon triangulifer]